jgi:hypothetical protein
MGKGFRTSRSRWIAVPTVVILSMLWSLSWPWAASADNPGAICVLKIASNKHKVLGVVVNEPQNFNIAIATPIDTAVNIPILCDGLETLALAVTNQNADNTRITAQVFTNDGTLLCSKGPFPLAGHGSQGVTFTDCQ